jgi:hypothetical protein
MNQRLTDDEEHICLIHRDILEFMIRTRLAEPWFRPSASKEAGRAKSLNFSSGANGESSERECDAV